MTKRKGANIKGIFYRKLYEAEKRGEYVPPPDEREPTPVEADAKTLQNKYGSPDALPLEYARMTLGELKLQETPEFLKLAWAFLKDEIEHHCYFTRRKYRRIYNERSKCSPEAYVIFYCALSPYVPDFPRPTRGNVVQMIITRTDGD